MRTATSRSRAEWSDRNAAPIRRSRRPPHCKQLSRPLQRRRQQLPPVAAAATVPADPGVLAQKNGCLTCHGMESKIVGPGLREVANKYQGRSDAIDYFAGKIKAGGTGVWGDIPMPPQTLSDDEARVIARWLANGATK